MRRKLAWIAFALLLASGAYGFFHEGLHRSDAWFPEGWRRFLKYAATFWIWTLALWIYRPGLLVPLTIAGAALYSIWWAGFAAILGPVVFLGSCRLVGKRLAPRADGGMALLLGLGAWIFAISLAVHFPINTRAVYTIALALPYVFGWRAAVALVRGMLPGDFAGGAGASRAQVLAIAILLFVLIAHLLVALKPETGADALAMHLVAPQLIAHEGKWDFDYERFAWALMPMGADWAYTAEYMLGGQAGTRLLNFAMLVVLAFMIRNTARRWLPETHATLAASLFASTPLVQAMTGNLFVENMWAAITLGALVALVDGELAWAGALLGTGLAVKFGTAAFLGPAIVVGAVIAVRDKRVRQAAFGMLLIVVFSAPTFGTAWYKTGNPVYPFMNHIFKAPSFESDEPFQDTRYRKPLAWTTAYDLTFRSLDYYEAQKGGMGFQYFLLLLPAALMMRRRPQLTLLSIALAAAIIGYLSQPNLRYLYPALAVISVGLAEFPIGWGLAAFTALNLYFLPAAGWNHREFALPDRAAAEAYLEVGHPQRKLIAYLNQNTPGEPAAFFEGNPIAGFHGRAYTDRWHTYLYVLRLGRLETADAVRAEFQRLGIRNIVAPASGKTVYPAANEVLRPLLGSPLAVSGGFAVFRLPESARASESKPPVSEPPASRPESKPPAPKRPEPKPPEPIPVSPGEYDNPNQSIQYTGRWDHRADFPEAINGTVSYSNHSGNTIRLLFQGSGIVYWYRRAFNRGIARISVDGKELTRLDLYSQEIMWRQSSRFEGLGRGVHTLEIRVSGERNPAATDLHVDLDQFTVLP